MNPFNKRSILALVVILAVSSAGVVATLPGDSELTPGERHELQEEREKAAILQAPGGGGVRYTEPPYDSKNTDGQAGSGGRAIAFRSGGRVDDSPAVVAEAPEARLWRTGYGSWEPTLGVNRRGTLFFSARNTNADPGVAISDDGGRTWRRSVPPAHEASLDPYIWLDESTGSLFASDIDPPVTCTPISRSDDDGRTWRYARACGVTDHQNHFGGPPPPGGEKPTGYPNVLYYCAISGGTLSDSSTITGCLKSLDGGSVWTITGDPAYTLKQREDGSFCDGPSGHGIVDRSGTVYVPRGWCGVPAIAISRDEGATWTRREVSDRKTPPFAHETSVAADAAGNLYYLFVGDDYRVYLVTSRDGGNTWSDERDVTPPGVARVSAFAPHLDAGDEGRLAFVFMGTADAEVTDDSPWTAYMMTTQNALADDPLLYVAPVTDVSTNALWKGRCDDLRCGNIGDFLDVEIGPDGSTWSALVDSCPAADDACILELTDALATPRGEGVVGQLSGGAPLVGTEAEQLPAIELPPSTPAPAPGATRRPCRSRRDFMIRLREPRRGRLRTARVYVNGKRVRVIRGGRRLRARINLKGLPAGRVTVRVVAVTTTGRRVVEKRRYRTCAGRRRS